MKYYIDFHRGLSGTLFREAEWEGKTKLFLHCLTVGLIGLIVMKVLRRMKDSGRIIGSSNQQKLGPCMYIGDLLMKSAYEILYSGVILLLKFIEENKIYISKTAFWKF